MAWLLPGAWWLQYLPDVPVVPMWCWSMVTGRRLQEASWLVRWRTFTHSLTIWSWACWFLLSIVLEQPWLFVHVLGHQLIDVVTHDKT